MSYIGLKLWCIKVATEKLLLDFLFITKIHVYVILKEIVQIWYYTFSANSAYHAIIYFIVASSIDKCMFYFLLIS